MNAPARRFTVQADVESRLRARIAELEHRLQLAEHEVGLSVAATDVAKLALAKALWPNAALVALALYQAKGRVLSTTQLEDAILRVDPAVKACAKLIASYVCYARKGLGAAAIGNVARVGYFMTTAGRDVVAAALERPL